MSTKSRIDSLLGQSFAHWKNNDLQSMVDCCNEILKIKPGDPQATANLGTALWTQGDSIGAEDKFREALKSIPEWPDILLNMATVLHDSGKVDEAKEYLEKLLKLRPFSSEAKWRMGVINLALGNYIEGWEGYEEGLGVAEIRGKLPGFSKRPWQGKACNHLLICHEQGIGDTLQFIRYAELCKERAIKVYFSGPEEMQKIVALCPYVDGVMGPVMESEFDEYIYTLSLPHVFRTTLKTIPNEVPYLVVPDSEKEKWDLPKDRFKVGLVWKGAPRKQEIKYHAINARRSMDFDYFRKLVDQFPHIEFYSLQKGDGEQDVNETVRITNLMPSVHNLVDTAALISHLDLVISVDTSVVHLAGALAKPVWVLSRFDACWRWLRNRQDSPWYPTARIFGQPVPGDWDSVLQKVAEELKKVTQ